MYRINWKFVEQREGGCQLDAYVPQQKGVAIGNSGVTVGTGVDLGARSRADIDLLNISESLKLKLHPYALLKREKAIQFLDKYPLSITCEEAAELDRAVKERDIRIMVNIFDSMSNVKFKDIPAAAQTVLASLTWNFGPNLNTKIPYTFSTALKQDWRQMRDLLREFPSKQPELDARRKLEADLLEEIC